MGTLGTSHITIKQKWRCLDFHTWKSPIKGFHKDSIYVVFVYLFDKVPKYVSKSSFVFSSIGFNIIKLKKPIKLKMSDEFDNT